jgi:hypothetical protein
MYLSGTSGAAESEASGFAGRRRATEAPIAERSDEEPTKAQRRAATKSQLSTASPLPGSAVNEPEMLASHSAGSASSVE